jgi:hypothetical protein
MCAIKHGLFAPGATPQSRKHRFDPTGCGYGKVMTVVADGHPGQETVPVRAADPPQDTSLALIVADLRRQAREQTHRLEATTLALQLLAEQILQHQQRLVRQAGGQPRSTPAAQR